MSYDSVDALRRFADEYDITYDLLSDEGSAVIESLGLLNQHTAAQHAYFGGSLQPRHSRLPYPGTFILDESGVVTSRIFDQSYRDRPGAGYLLHRATGAPPRAARSASAGDAAVTVTAWVDGAVLRPLQLAEVHVEIEIAPGWHVYCEPVPRGYTALSVALADDPGLTALPAELPSGRPFTVMGLPEQFYVLDGGLRISLPFRLAGAGFLLDGRNDPAPAAPVPVELRVEVHYQACSDIECLPPATQQVSLIIEEGERAMPPS